MAPGPRATSAARASVSWCRRYRDPIKTRTVVSCINGTLEIQARLREVTAPVYVQQGTLDKTCSVVALRQLLPRFGSKDVTYHEVQVRGRGGWRHGAAAPPWRCRRGRRRARGEGGAHRCGAPRRAALWLRRAGCTT